MKILKLKAENFKRLQAVEISPSGEIIQLTGKNAQGKSSILDSIIAAIAGKKHMPDKAIRDGERKGKIELELDGLLIARTFNAKGTGGIEVTNTETGESLKSPQAVLDALKSQLTFDPLEFGRMKLQDQIKLLQDASGCGDRIRELNDDYKTIFDERTILNRQVKTIEAKIDDLPILSANIPDEEINITDLSQKLTEANAANNKRQSIETQIETQRGNIRSLQERIDRLKRELADAEEQKIKATEQGKKLAIELAGITAIDTAPILEQMNNQQEINKKISQKRRYNDLKAEYKAVADKADEMTEELDDIKAEKLKIIQKSNLPVDGLMFDEDGIMLNGIPIEQISSGEKTQLSVAIGMALNPELRVMLIHDGSLLDAEKLQNIAEMAKDKDYQIWVESVDESGKVGVFIEDGMVAVNNYETVAA